jgi:hypothetical protein
MEEATPKSWRGEKTGGGRVLAEWQILSIHDKCEIPDKGDNSSV